MSLSMLALIKPENIVTIDFETFYDKGYSLTDKDLNMSEYVRHERFHMHCAGVKLGGAPVRVLRGKEFDAFVSRVGWKDKLVLAHNTAFDGFILSERYGVHPAGYLDTLSMSRALYGAAVGHGLDDVANRLGLGGKIKNVLKSTKGLMELPDELMSKLMEYCGNDVDLCYNVFWKLYPSFPDVELRLVDQTLKMFCAPKLLIDTGLVTAELDKEVAKKEAALKTLEEQGITREQLMSNQKFAKLLEERGIPVPMKKSPTTGKQTLALAKSDPEFRMRLDDEDPAVKILFQARLTVKTTISETRAKRFLSAGSQTMRMPILLNYYGAHTGRWSGGNKLNLQNLPRGGALRRSLLAPTGMVVVVADSSQIEARTTAWLAGQNDLLDSFAKGEDVYRKMAAKIYGKTPEDISELERFVGKTCILGLGYGMGANKLQASLALGAGGKSVRISQSEASSIVSIYRNSNPKIVGLWYDMDKVLQSMNAGDGGAYKILRWGPEHISLPNQMKLHYPDLGPEYEDGKDLVYRTRFGWTKIYGGLLTENVVQALARIIVAEQMLAIGERYDVVTMSHDEVVWLAPEDEAEEAFKFGKKIMSTPPAWAPDLPLNVSGGYDKCYSK